MGEAFAFAFLLDIALLFRGSDGDNDLDFLDLRQFRHKPTETGVFDDSGGSFSILSGSISISSMDAFKSDSSSKEELNGRGEGVLDSD